MKINLLRDILSLFFNQTSTRALLGVLVTIAPLYAMEQAQSQEAPASPNTAAVAYELRPAYIRLAEDSKQYCAAEPQITTNRTMPALSFVPAYDDHWRTLTKKEDPYEYSPSCPWPTRCLLRGHVGDLMSRVTPPQPCSQPTHATHAPRIAQDQQNVETHQESYVRNDAPEIPENWLPDTRVTTDDIMHELFGQDTL